MWVDELAEYHKIVTLNALAFLVMGLSDKCASDAKQNCVPIRWRDYQLEYLSRHEKKKHSFQSKLIMYSIILYVPYSCQQ
jgi:hypothetical protein